jgi:hypothetical protein
MLWLLITAGLITASANALPPASAEPVSCAYRVNDLAAPELFAQAERAIASWREQLKRDSRDPQIRQSMADYAINLLQRVNRLDAVGLEAEAAKLRRFVIAQLPDTSWRIQHQAELGDLGAIEARIAWLRADANAESEAICTLAARGAVLGGAESYYRLALCTTAAAAALQDMQKAAALGHPAAMETVGRLCISGRLQADCKLEPLCRAAQAGRIGAAAAIGWHLTGPELPESGDGPFWLRRAAEAGDALAQNNYGELLERQLAGSGDLREALGWYRRAAEQGLPAAMVNAARVLAAGSPADCLQAQNLLEKAGNSGLAQATAWRQSLHCDQIDPVKNP